MTQEIDLKFCSQNAQLYRNTLLNDVVPFWLEYAVDASGAINNCISDDGTVLSKDRFIWSQGRALWTFSALYNQIEDRSQWRETADGLFNYLANHGRDDNGHWMYLLDEFGHVLQKDTSIFVDGFVLNGMAEYYTATGSGQAADIAIQTYQTIAKRLACPGSYQISPYKLEPGMKSLGVNMIFAFFFHLLGRQLAKPDICQAGENLAYEILDLFYQRDRNLLLEFISQDGKAKLDAPQGSVCVPGHVIEAMWFLIDIFTHSGDKQAVGQCCGLIKRHLELGWDRDFGGMRLAIDITGSTEVDWKNPDCKPWWVQVESLVATAYAYLRTADQEFIDWHLKIQSWAYARYPQLAGEWTQWLNRQGQKQQSAALPVKDPFHLPRGLIYLTKLLQNPTDL